MEKFVKAIQPGAVLRRKRGLDVRVGSHVAPPGGPAIEYQLEEILNLAHTAHPFEVHQQYETLQNRREASRAMALGFLHLWYYQSLDASRANTSTQRDNED